MSAADQGLESQTPLLDKTSEFAVEKQSSQKGILCTILFFMCCSLSVDTLLYPFFPSVAQDKGLTSTQIGFVFSSYDLARFLTSPIIGSVLSKWHPKSVCIFGNIFTASTCIMFGTLDKVSSKNWFLALCISSRFLAGMGSAMLTVAATSILLKATAYNASTIVAVIEMMEGAAYAVGPTYGAALYAIAGYGPMFWIIGGLMFGFLPVFISLVPKVEEANSSDKNFLDLLAIPGCTLMSLTCLVVKINSIARYTGISNWITSKYQQTLSFVGVFFGIGNVVYMITCAIVSRVTDRGYIYGPMIVGVALAAISNFMTGPSELISFAFQNTRCLWLLFITDWIFNVGVAYAYITPFQAALDLAHVNGHHKDSIHTYGMVTGLINCGYSFGSTVGAVLSGAITDSLDFPWSLTISAFLGLATASLILIYWIYMKAGNHPLVPTNHTVKMKE